MTITYIISSLGPGGAERQLVNLVNVLPDTLSVHIIVLKQDVSMARHLTHPKVDVHRLNLRRPYSLKGWTRLLALLTDQKPDIVHSHMFLSNMAARLAKLFCRYPVLVNHDHGLSSWKGPFLCLLDRASQGLADKSIVVSDASRQLRLRREHLSRSRVLVLPNAIPWQQWADVRRTNPNRYTTWGVAARLTPNKRVELVLHLLAMARDAGARAKLLIAGDGPQRDSLTDRCHQLGLDDCVQFLGHVRDMRDFYAQVDVVLLTSILEDCPLTILEALAAGRFVVGSRAGGLPEILGGAPDALLLQDPSKGHSAARVLASIPAGFDSTANREFARKYDVASYRDAVLRLYADLIKEAEPR